MDVYSIILYLSSVVFCLLLVVFIYLNRLARDGKCKSTVKLDGKTVIVTGANCGIGKETAKDIAKRGATVILACRNMESGEIALQEIKESSGNSNVFLRKLDLNCLTSVKKFAENFLEEFTKLHILINNAGIMPVSYGETEDGFESNFGVNHLGHFALTNLLLNKIVDSAPSRIVNVSSKIHIYFDSMDLDDLKWKRRGYSALSAYGQSKLANVLFTKELHKRLVDKNVTSYAVHPGIVHTNISRHSPFLFFLAKNLGFLYTYICKTPEEGAQAQIFCAIDESVVKDSGKYFENCRTTRSSKMSYDVGIAKKLWEKSEVLTGIDFPL